jgi:hypothetical protein
MAKMVMNDPALQRAIYEDVYRDLFQELTGSKTQ